MFWINFSAMDDLDSGVKKVMAVLSYTKSPKSASFRILSIIFCWSKNYFPFICVGVSLPFKNI